VFGLQHLNVTLFALAIGIGVLAIFRRENPIGWKDYWSRLNKELTNPFLLAVNSRLDEAWQVLHHVRNLENPLTPKSGPFRFVFATIGAQLKRSAEIARIQGVSLFRDQSIVSKPLIIVLYLVPIGLIIFNVADYKETFSDIARIRGREALAKEYAEIQKRLDSEPHTPKLIKERRKLQDMMDLTADEEDELVAWAATFLDVLLYVALVIGSVVFISFVTLLLGQWFYSAALAPFRGCARFGRVTIGIVNDVGIYIVRRRAWGLLQELALGLEGYRFSLPQPELMLSIVSADVARQENLPKAVEQRALERRGDWVKKHLGDVSDTFAKLATTSADLARLQHTIETDLSLVHAAYYTDDQCIERIADRIAGVDQETRALRVRDSWETASHRS
jgi:hypothetical protein